MSMKPLSIVGHGTLKGRRAFTYHMRPEVVEAVKSVSDGPTYLVAEYLMMLGIAAVLGQHCNVILHARDVCNMCPPMETPGHEPSPAA